MGECGCGATIPEVVLDGPGGVKYGIQVYLGCRDCHAPLAIDIYRFDEEFAADFFDGVPPLTIQTYGSDPDERNGVGTIVLFDPADLVRLAREQHLGTPVDELDHEDWRDLLGQAYAGMAADSQVAEGAEA